MSRHKHTPTQSSIHPPRLASLDWIKFAKLKLKGNWSMLSLCSEHHWVLHCHLPVPCALEPVEDVSTARIVDLVKGMSVGLLHSHGVAAGKDNHSWKCADQSLTLRNAQQYTKGHSALNKHVWLRVIGHIQLFHSAHNRPIGHPLPDRHLLIASAGQPDSTKTALIQPPPPPLSTTYCPPADARIGWGQKPGDWGKAFSHQQSLPDISTPPWQSLLEIKHLCLSTLFIFTHLIIHLFI